MSTAESSTKSGHLGKHSSKTYYKMSQKKRKFGGGPRPLHTDVQGILITTGDKEKLCVSEAYNLLNEYADELYGPEVSLSDLPDAKDQSDASKDVASNLDREIARLKEQHTRERRFSAMDAGAKHVVFIRCSEQVDTTELVYTILSDIHTTKIKKSRFCQRILPVVKVCHASLSSIKKCAMEVLEPHFHSNTTDVHKFSVNYKARNNNDIKRDDVVRLVAGLVTLEDQFPHRVDCDNPELVIIVEIIKNLCCMSVVRDFHKFRKYNIQSLVDPPQPQASHLSQPRQSHPPGLELPHPPGPEQPHPPQSPHLEVENQTRVGEGDATGRGSETTRTPPKEHTKATKDSETVTQGKVDVENGACLITEKTDAETISTISAESERRSE